MNNRMDGWMDGSNESIKKCNDEFMKLLMVVNKWIKMYQCSWLTNYMKITIDKRKWMDCYATGALQRFNILNKYINERIT